MRPASGHMYWWRKKGALEWRFGYCSYVMGHPDLVRFGPWNGNTVNGPVVSVSEIEWKDYYA